LYTRFKRTIVTARATWTLSRSGVDKSIILCYIGCTIHRHSMCASCHSRPEQIRIFVLFFRETFWVFSSTAILLRNNRIHVCVCVWDYIIVTIVVGAVVFFFVFRKVPSIYNIHYIVSHPHPLLYAMLVNYTSLNAFSVSSEYIYIYSIVLCNQ